MAYVFNLRIFNLTIYEMLSCFIIFSVLGWFIEIIIRLLKTRQLTNKGFLTGPYAPLYGISFTIVALMLPLGLINIFTIFVCVIIAANIEYVTALLLELFTDCKWWNYENSRFNFKGYASLLTSLFRGLIFTVALYAINTYDVIIYLDKIKNIKIYGISSYEIIILVLIIMIWDFINSCFLIKNLNKKLFDMFHLNRKLRHFVENSDLIATSEDLLSYSHLDIVRFYENAMELIETSDPNHPLYTKEVFAEKCTEMMNSYNNTRDLKHKKYKRLLKAYPDFYSLEYHKELIELARINNL